MLVAQDEEKDSILSISDIVIYSSLHEEQSFPDILLKAMCFGKPIVAPDLPIIKKYVGNYLIFLTGIHTYIHISMCVSMYICQPYIVYFTIFLLSKWESNHFYCTY